MAVTGWFCHNDFQRSNVTTLTTLIPFFPCLDFFLSSKQPFSHLKWISSLLKPNAKSASFGDGMLFFLYQQSPIGPGESPRFIRGSGSFLCSVCMFSLCSHWSWYSGLFRSLERCSWSIVYLTPCNYFSLGKVSWKWDLFFIECANYVLCRWWASWNTFAEDDVGYQWLHSREISTCTC